MIGNSFPSFRQRKLFISVNLVITFIPISMTQATEFIKQPLSPEMQLLFTTESFNVACSSVLKEMAVNCDLTVLEEVFLKY